MDLGPHEEVEVDSTGCWPFLFLFALSAPPAPALAPGTYPRGSAAPCPISPCHGQEVSSQFGGQSHHGDPQAMMASILRSQTRLACLAPLQCSHGKTCLVVAQCTARLSPNTFVQWVNGALPSKAWSPQSPPQLTEWAITGNEYGEGFLICKK